ncbi:MAG: M55 family metallopeptidase [Candidatus Obscuribacterales bacterium]|nr:M55 family metallopeptidase [Candidatus Obscuribacterales bacterium]
MRIYISADLEGVNGIVHSSQTQPGEPGYERAVALMHQELAAVIKGARSAGATDIYVADAHWDGRNLRHELLPEGVTLLSGWQRPYSMVAGISGKAAAKELCDKPFDGAFFVGYHARAGVACGVLSHTYRAQVFLDVKLNGKSVGEIGLNAALAGFFGVPIGLVTGDDAACQEAIELLGPLPTVAVKKAISRYSAAFMPAQESLESLRHSAVEAMNKRDYWNVYFPPKPSTLQITFFDPAMADGAELLPGVKRCDDRQIEITDEDYSVLFRLFLAAGAIGASRKDPHF